MSKKLTTAILLNSSWLSPPNSKFFNFSGPLNNIVVAGKEFAAVYE